LARPPGGHFFPDVLFGHRTAFLQVWTHIFQDKETPMIVRNLFGYIAMLAAAFSVTPATKGFSV
jgi:hypothetical protein